MSRAQSRPGSYYLGLFLLVLFLALRYKLPS